MGDPEESLGSIKVDFFELVRRLHQMKPSPFEQFEGVTPTEARALLMIGVMQRSDNAGDLRPGQISERMCVAPSALSQVLKSLEGKGLVERRHGAQDSRSVSLTLTQAGWDLSSRVDECWTVQARAIVDYVGAEDFQHLLRTALRVCDYFDKVRAGKVPSPFEGMSGVRGGSAEAGEEARGVGLRNGSEAAAPQQHARAASEVGERPCA